MHEHLHEHEVHAETEQAGIDRRSLLRIGGFTLAGAALLSACADDATTSQIPIAGASPTYAPPKEKPITDIVLLRTASSFEMSLVDAHLKVLQNNWITDPEVLELINTFIVHHQQHAASFAELTTAAGGTACLEYNHKVTDYYFQPALQEISVAGPSQQEDAKAFVDAIENLAASTQQAFTEMYSQPSLRRAAMAVGGVEGRHAALIAAVLNPERLVGSAAAADDSGSDTAPTTTIVTGLPTTAPGATTTTAVLTAAEANEIIAIPGAFGSLAPVQLVVGPSDENGVRPTFSLETPSLNSFLYEDEACAPAT